jgi:hypothetical protein
MLAMDDGAVKDHADEHLAAFAVRNIGRAHAAGARSDGGGMSRTAAPRARE